MSKLKTAVLTAGSLAVLMSGVAMAAGPVGVAPPGGFSIDDALFDAANVSATACPVGSTCTTLTGSGGDMLQREVTDTLSGTRFIQTIIGDVTGSAEFANESRITQQTTNSIAAKMRIDDAGAGPGDEFFTEHTLYRTNFDLSGGFPALELVQNLGGTFQTFNMELPGIPNNGAQVIGSGQIDIDQNIGGAAGVFAHRILRGAGYFPTDFSLDVVDGNGGIQNMARAAANAGGGLTATYIGATMPGGGAGEDALGAAEREFGVMIYRFFSANAADGVVTSNNTSNGGSATEEIRATSQLSSVNDSGEMTAGTHGAFVNGDAVSMGWDETLFGPAPL